MSAYAVTAQYYDAIAAAHRDAVNPHIAAALTGLETARHPIVDIGAGTGLTTQVIADTLPAARILAIEPDAAMRAGLMVRVCSSADLRRRVSILPAGALEAPLPERISAAVAGASLEHFSPTQRRQLWALLAERLSPGGRAVVEIQCPLSQDLPETFTAGAAVGELSYECWACAERIDDLRQRWRMTYVTLSEGVELERQIANFVCWVASAEQVLAEAGACGLSGHERQGLVVLYPGA